MRKIIKITIISVLSIMVVAYVYYFLRWSDYVTSGELEVKDISKDTLLMGINKSIKRGPLGRSLHITGEVDDSVSIYNIIAKGKIDTIIDGEFYNDTTHVAYKANNAKKGHLKIKYKFYVY